MNILYDIATGIEIGKMKSIVYKYLEEEWELLGGPFAFKGLVCQALTKTVKPVKETNQDRGVDQ